ncbi:carbohydrate kinase family protein [Patescibacteria group bacterium]|nr:carbohydrate kinase family protein [Patescibacteria group bacterium]
MKSKTMSIGGATYDLFVRTTEDLIHECDTKKSIALPLGSKVRVEEVIETCGGGASNSSVGLARLGCSAGFCGVISSDQWGEKLLENLKKEGVNIDCATIVENEISSFSIILSTENGERVILYTPGTNVHLHDANFNKDVIGKMNWVYLNHIQEDSCVIQDDIIEMLANEKEPRFTWNPGGCQLDEGLSAPNNKNLLSHTDLVLLNNEEALQFTKTDSIDDAIRTMLSIGAKNVCITQGKEGTIASDGKNLYHCPAIIDATVIDTTGAGDAFGTGATWALLNGEDLLTAVKAGTINATSVVGAIGAQAGLLTDTEIKEKLAQTNLAVNVRPL